MKKILILLTCLLLVPSLALAEGIYIFEFELHRDKTVDFISLQKSEGTVTKSQKGSYAVLLADESGAELWQTTFPAVFIVTTTPPKLLDSITMTVKLPADPRAKAVGIMTEDGEILFARPITSSCDMDGTCDENEDYFSCPVDCKSGSADGVCDSVSDGKCDPDCSASGDPDCEIPEAGGGMNWKLILGALIVIGVGGFLFFQYKKKAAAGEGGVKVGQKEDVPKEEEKMEKVEEPKKVTKPKKKAPKKPAKKKKLQ